MPLILPRATDNAEAQLDAGVSASSSTILLSPAGSGDKFPQPIAGTAGAGGSATDLPAAGASGLGIAVGDFLENLTDGSHAFVIAVLADRFETTPLRGGSANLWADGDAFVAGRFIVTLQKRDDAGAVTNFEKVLVGGRSGDQLLVSERGFEGSSQQSFAADDWVSLFVTARAVEDLRAALGEQAGSVRALEKVAPSPLEKAQLSRLLGFGLTHAPGSLAVTVAGGVYDSRGGAAAETALILAPSATNFIEIDPTTGTISSGTAEFRSDRLALWEVVTDATGVASAADRRQLWGDFAPGAPVVASQADAEAGTDNVKMMTAARVVDAIRSRERTETLAIAGEDLAAGDVCFIGKKEYFSPMTAVTESAYVDASNSNGNFGTSTSLLVSKYSSQEKYSYLKVPTAIATPPAGFELGGSAALRIYGRSNSGYNISFRLSVPQTTWDQYSINWGNKPAVTDLQVASSFFLTNTAWQTLTFESSAQIQNIADHGLCLQIAQRQSDTANDYLVFNSEESAYDPVMTVSYRDTTTKAWKATANIGSETAPAFPMRARAIAAEPITAGSTGRFILEGLCDAPAATTGETYFLGTTAGSTTTTPPTWSQRLGHEVNGKFYFRPEGVKYFSPLTNRYSYDREGGSYFYPEMTYFTPKKTTWLYTGRGSGSGYHYYFDGEMRYQGSSVWRNKQVRSPNYSYSSGAQNNIDSSTGTNFQIYGYSSNHTNQYSLEFGTSAVKIKNTASAWSTYENFLESHFIFEE